MYLSLLLKLVAIIPTAILLIYLCRELIVYQNLNFYRRQGLKCFYIPVIGAASLFIKKKSSNDQLEQLRKMMIQNADEPIVAFNTPRTLKPIVYLIGDDIIREFYVKELDCSIKPSLNKHSHFGFFFQDGELLMESRQIYAQFFNYGNLKMLNKQISTILDRMMNQYKREISQDSWTKIDIKQYLDGIFSELVKTTLFGESKNRYVGDKNLTMAIKTYINECFSVASDPINMLSLDLLNNLSLLKSTRDCKLLFEQIKEVCWTIYQERKQSGPKEQPNLLDLLIKLNEERVKIGNPELTKSEIAGHFNLLQFAGSDTSHEMTSNILYLLSKMPEVRTNFVDMVDEIFNESQVPASEFSCEDYQKHSKYELYCDEFMRVVVILPSMSPRELIKDVKLGKYQLKKGDRINIVGGLISQLTRFYPQGESFDPEKLAEIRKTPGRKPVNFVFGMGKRICVGKSLGDMMVKLILAHFCRNFDIAHDVDYLESKAMKLTYGFVSPSILVKPRHLGTASPI
jgi:cytochrome P450